MAESKKDEGVVHNLLTKTVGAAAKVAEKAKEAAGGMKEHLEAKEPTAVDDITKGVSQGVKGVFKQATFLGAGINAGVDAAGHQVDAVKSLASTAKGVLEGDLDRVVEKSTGAAVSQAKVLGNVAYVAVAPFFRFVNGTRMVAEGGFRVARGTAKKTAGTIEAIMPKQKIQSPWALGSGGIVNHGQYVQLRTVDSAIGPDGKPVSINHMTSVEPVYTQKKAA